MNKNMIQKCFIASGILCACLSAQAQYNTAGDVLISFRNSAGGTANDLIVDLGQYGSLHDGVVASVVPSQVSTVGGASLNNISWSLATISADGNSIYVSSPSQLKNQSDDKFGTIQGVIATVGGNIVSGNSATVSQTDPASYTSAGAFGTYGGFTSSVEGVGAKTLGIYSVLDGTGNATLVGQVSLGQDGTVTLSGFTPVPEAANFGMVAAGAMMVMFAFNTLRARQATR